MFTGIIEELGVVKSLDRKGAISILQISAPGIARDTLPAQSICLNGACLTVVRVEKDILSFEIMPQTLRDTNLGQLSPAAKVNLERALKVNARLDGHFVTGHIDGTGQIRTPLPAYIRGGQEIRRKAGDVVIEIAPDLERILHYIALKGSVAVDGVSLTVSAQRAGSFCVNLIPYTLEHTTLGLRKEQDVVNIECDILARYMDRLLPQNKQSSVSNITSSFLTTHGFI